MHRLLFYRFRLLLTGSIEKALHLLKHSYAQRNYINVNHTYAHTYVCYIHTYISHRIRTASQAAKNNRMDEVITTRLQNNNDKFTSVLPRLYPIPYKEHIERVNIYYCMYKYFR